MKTKVLTSTLTSAVSALNIFAVGSRVGAMHFYNNV